MESYHSMNRNELLRKLQRHDKYTTMSQKNIGTNKTIKELREELYALDIPNISKKSSKSSPKKSEIYDIDGEEYTKDELKTMIAFFKKHHPSTNNTYNINIIQPSLPDDVIREILYKSDINTIINYCTTNKYQHICNDNNFWKYIFQRDNIKMIENPTNTQEWITMYKRTSDAQKEALVLETLPRNITSGVYEFHITGNFNDYFKKYDDSLPKTNKFYTNMYSKDGMLRYYGRKDKFITKEEFYQLLVDILYFYPDVTITTVGTNDDVPLRKKEIGKLRNKQGYKTIAGNILRHNHHINIMLDNHSYDDIRHNFNPK